jgi:hypothetical protein
MRRLAAALAMLGACPARVESPRQPVEPVAPDARVLAATRLPGVDRPSLDLAVVLPVRAGLPWPLKRMPSLEPQWGPAREPDACGDDWARHHDADSRAYARAWCRIRAGDRSAIAELARLGRDGHGELAHGAVIDVIDLVSDQFDARLALARLKELSLISTDTLDTLAATYLARGSRRDAELVEARASGMDPQPSTLAACERALEYGKLDDPEIDRRLIAIDYRAGDCAAAAHAAACMLYLGRHEWGRPLGEPCSILSLEPERRERVALVALYFSWSRDPQALVHIAREAKRALQIEGIEELAVTALEQALVESRCNRPILAGVAVAAADIALEPAHSHDFDARLARLRAPADTGCSR